jgi:hypothetical protein
MNVAYAHLIDGISAESRKEWDEAPEPGTETARRRPAGRNVAALMAIAGGMKRK